jgi:hypothetical protein
LSRSFQAGMTTVTSARSATAAVAAVVAGASNSIRGPGTFLLEHSGTQDQERRMRIGAAAETLTVRRVIRAAIIAKAKSECEERRGLFYTLGGRAARPR